MIELTSLLGMLGTQEIVIILVIVLLLFGGRKIPELMRGLGKGVKEFKDGMNGDGQPNSNNTDKDSQNDTNIFKK